MTPLLQRLSLVLLAVTLIACPGDTSPPPGPGATAATPPRAGGTLKVLLAEDVDALDPQRAAQPPAWGLLRAMHRGLMAFPAEAGPDGARPVPDLAEEAPAVSADGLRYTFRLREGAAFGPPASRPVVAADVKAGIERAVTAGSPVAGYLRVIRSISTPDERTVVIALSRPVNDLLWLLALPATSAVTPGLPPVTSAEKISSSGPYRLAEEDGYRAERSIHLVRNDAWSEDSDPVRSAWVDEIRVEIGVASNEIRRRLLSGDADLSGDVAPGELAPDEVSAERLVRAPNGCLRYLFLNTRVPPFSSRAVRVAVSGVAPRQAVADSYDGSATPAVGILPPTVDGHLPDVVAPTPDPAAAKAALGAAGQPRGFATRLVAGNQSIDHAHAAAVRSALARIGVRVDVETVPIASLYEDRYEVAAARTPMGIATWCADWPGLGGRGALGPLVDGRAVVARSSTNYSGISDRRLNSLLDAAAAERNPAAQLQRWRAAEAEARRQAVVVPLAYLDEISVLGPDVRGFVPHPYFLRGDLTAVWLDRP